MASSIHPSKAGFVCVTILALSLCIPAQAAEFAGGTGTVDDPYWIATAEQLTSIGSDPNLADKHFVLLTDIDLDPNRSGSGSLKSPLRLSMGSLDGAGHRIINFQPVSSRTAVDALFEVIGPGAVVRNLSLGAVSTGVRTEQTHVAMLARRNKGTILNCRAEGTLLGNSGGGLVAENLGSIVNCSTGGQIACDRGGDGVGALVGTNFGTIRYCHSTASVLGGSGLVGKNFAMIEACWAGGAVTEGLGGLVGENLGTVRWCYAAGEVSTTGGLAGGLVGANSGTVACCDATGRVWAGERAGRLVGSNVGRIVQCYAGSSGGGSFVADNDWQGTIANCYALAPTEPFGPDDGFTVLLTDAQMRRRESFVGWDFAGTSFDGTSDDWMMPEDGGYPALTAIDGLGFTGRGTRDDPYRVRAAHQLMAISCAPEACYRLEADIDLAGRSFSHSVIPLFWGHLDGGGHIVYDFILTGQEDVGLVGTLHRGSDVVDLHLDRVRVEAVGDNQHRIGALAACNYGTIADCSAAVQMMLLGEDAGFFAGGLIGSNNDGEVHRCSVRVSLVYQFIGSRAHPYSCGGLVGQNTGTLDQCHAFSYTNGEARQFGGLVGDNAGRIEDCYCDGYIRGDGGAGLAYSNAGTIMNCYAAVTVHASQPAGGLVAENVGGDILSCYFLATADGGGFDNGLGIVSSDAAMRQQASFIGWDFDDVWTIDEGMDYPRLRWEGVTCDQ